MIVAAILYLHFYPTSPPFQPLLYRYSTAVLSKFDKRGFGNSFRAVPKLITPNFMNGSGHGTRAPINQRHGLSLTLSSVLRHPASVLYSTLIKFWWGPTDMKAVVKLASL